MNRHLGSQKSQGDVTLPTSAFTNLEIAYASLDELKQALLVNGNETGVVIPLQLPSRSDIPFRFQFGLTSNASENATIDEICYRVVLNGDAEGGVELHELYQATWTVSTEDSLITDQHYCDVVTLSDAGLSEAVTGVPIGSVNGPPALVCAADPGNASAFVRLFKRGGTGTAGSCIPRGALEA
ncbi:MAG: hypothetical protein AAF108_02855 [Planctomycetota bacterium]